MLSLKTKTNSGDLRIIIHLFLMTLLPLLGFSQKNNISLLYNDKAQFRPDTSLRISLDQWKIWKETELEIYNVCGHGNLANNLRKEIARDKFNIRNIISFDCDSTGIKNIIYVKKYPKTWDGDGTKEDIKKVTKHKNDIFQMLKNVNKKFYNDTLNIYGKYYINL